MPKKRVNTIKKRPSVVEPPRIEPPAVLDVDERKLWDVLVQTPWLTKYDRFNLHMFCCAQAKYNRDPKAVSGALVSRLKSLGTKLRFDAPPDKRKAHHMLFPTEQTDKHPSRYDFFGDETPEETCKRKEYYGLGEDDE